MSFIIDCVYSGKHVCILHHFSFHHDESKTNLLETVVWLLNFIRKLIHDHIPRITEKTYRKEDIDSILLISTGGDVAEGLQMRKVCILIYQNVFDFGQWNLIDAELHLIYRKLAHRVVLFHPVLKIPSLADENEDGKKVINIKIPII